MDVSPWPRGRGFAGGAAWWEYVLNKDERRRIDQLLGAALLDAELCERLVSRREAALMDAFGLAAETQSWLRGIRANTLEELAQAIVDGPAKAEVEAA
jgi:hypothetical protein